jgi:hypothetical protein
MGRPGGGGRAVHQGGWATGGPRWRSSDEQVEAAAKTKVVAVAVRKQISLCGPHCWARE